MLVPPMVWIQNQLVGAALGQRITLECQSEAYPKSINYWMKNDSIIIQGMLAIINTNPRTFYKWCFLINYAISFGVLKIEFLLTNLLKALVLTQLLQKLLTKLL